MSISRASAAAVMCIVLIISTALGQESRAGRVDAKQIRIVLLGNRSWTSRTSRAGTSTLLQEVAQPLLERLEA
jgi:hypothetical protein